MTALWLTRARLRRDAPVAALAPLLLPDGEGPRAAASHRLVWALFTDGPDRRRDFLWREEAPGRFLALSPRPPDGMSGLFDLDSKPFEPVLRAGDRLGFALRANAVVTHVGAPGGRGKRHDVVMDALRGLPKDERAARRLETVVSAGRCWLARQGAAHGFEPDGSTGVDGYDQLRIDRGTKARPATFGLLDFDGALTVQDPVRFLRALAAGFGRARAFGCGLMLIRRLGRA